MPDLIKKPDPVDKLSTHSIEPRYIIETVESQEGELSLLILRLRDFILQVVLRHKWLVSATTASFLLLAIIQTFTTTPIYRASILVQVDPESIRILPYQDLTQTSYMSTEAYMETQVRIIKSRSLAERLVRNLHLVDNPSLQRSPSRGVLVEVFHTSLAGAMNLLNSLRAEEQKPVPATQSTPEEKLLLTELITTGRVMNYLTARTVPKSRFIEIAFSSPDPVTAANVVNAAAEEFIRLDLERRFETNETVAAFLEGKLKEVQIKVEKSEEALNEYAKANGILDLEGQEEIVTQKLSDLSRQITEVEGRLSSEAARHESIRDATVENFPPSLKSPTITALETRLSMLRQQEANLLSIYDSGWPGVIQIREEITELEKQLRNSKQEALEVAGVSYRQVQRERRNLLASLEHQKTIAGELNEKLVPYTILKREAETSRQLYESVLQRLRETSVSSGMEATNFRIIDPAPVPGGASEPRPVINLFFALVLGLGSGVGLATLISILDNTVKTPEEVERISRLPSLGIIPSIRLLKKANRQSILRPMNGEPSDTAIIPWGDFAAASWEPYRALRTSILLSHADSPPRIILVTSPLPGEGKSTTAVNLSIVLAQSGASTLLIDGDMRKPRLTEIFRIKEMHGMSELLSGNSESLPNIANTAVPNLSVIAAGRRPPNPAELLGSHRMKAILKLLRQTFEYIIVDSPPVLSCTDAVILSTLADGTVLVSRSGQTPRNSLLSATQRLWSVNATLLGCVINNVDLTKPEYSYYYGHYHQHYHYYERNS